MRCHVESCVLLLWGFAHLTVTLSSTLDNSRQLSVTLGNTRQLSATLGNSGQLSATLGNSWQLSATLGNSRQLTATLGNTRQLSATLGNSRQLTATLGNSRQLSLLFDRADDSHKQNAHASVDCEQASAHRLILHLSSTIILIQPRLNTV